MNQSIVVFLHYETLKTNITIVFLFLLKYITVYSWELSSWEEISKNYAAVTLELILFKQGKIRKFDWELNQEFLSGQTYKLLLLFNHPVVSDSLWSNGLQYARLPCPSLSPWVLPNSCPLSWLCLPTVSSSITPPLLILSSIFPSTRVFSTELAFCIVAKVLEL